MNTVTITIPQVKINLDIDDITFDTLENTVFHAVQHIGRKTLEKALFDIDERLRDERAKKVLENKGRKEKYFFTRLGTIRYKRRRYIDKMTGMPKYLLEEKLKIEKNQRVSLQRSKIEMAIASVSPYRETQKNAELLTGSKRSHEAIRQSVIKEGKKMLDHQKHAIEKIKRFEDCPKEAISHDIAYIETDEAHIRLQRRKKRKNQTKRKRKRKTIAVKLGIGYTGREPRYKKGDKTALRLKDKFTYVAIQRGKNFMEDLSLMAEKMMNLSMIKNVFVGGDGDTWIRNGIRDFFPGAMYLLCLFHLFRNIKRALSRRKDAQKTIKRLIIHDKIGSALGIIKRMINKPKDTKEKEALTELYHYIQENRHGINAINRIEDKEIKNRVKRTGAIEPNIDKVIAHRFKKRGMSWSPRGAISLLKIKETVINGSWDNWWLSERSEKIEIRTGSLTRLTAKDFWKKETNRLPLLEVDIPALRGPDQNEPWAKAIRDLQDIDYYK